MGGKQGFPSSASVEGMDVGWDLHILFRKDKGIVEWVRGRAW